jgi:diguanylate cyclase (GGDEF)-like protein
MLRSKLRTYLDTGSLTLFSQQILEALIGAKSVAVHDSDGVVVWIGPDDSEKSLWDATPLTGANSSGKGYRKDLEDQHVVYVFFLHDDSVNESIGTLSVLVKSGHPISFEFAFKEIKSVLECVNRQLSVNVELSAIRHISTQSRGDIQFLVQLDEFDPDLSIAQTVQGILDLTAQHFDCQITTCMMPRLGVQEVFPETKVTESDVKPLKEMLDRLYETAKDKKLDLSFKKMKYASGPLGDILNDANMLCSPINNVHDAIIGILVLVRETTFSNNDIELIRAICTKINSLTKSVDEISDEIFSRHGFLHHVDGVLKRHPNSPHALLYLNIDKLHVVNDAFGHAAGDQVISTITRIVSELAGSNDAVAQLSGDRLGVFLRDCDEDKACNKADLMLGTIGRQSLEYDKKIIDLSASIGIALIPDVVTNASSALNVAEVAARSAHDRGGSRAVVFRDLDLSMVQRRCDLGQVGYIQHALLENQFVLFAQEILSAKEDHPGKQYELLVRMLDAKGNIIMPAMFLSAAERYQMMVGLDRWVVNNAIREISENKQMLKSSSTKFSINVSAQSLADDNFLDHLQSVIKDSGISPEALCFEITESAAVRNLDRARRFIRVLRKLGCSLALDDFGTGYCSFAYLKDLPVQYIKIDGVFVRDILENPLSETIVAATVSIAKVLGAATVAEHVENDLVLQRLRRHEIDFFQGFAISKPLPLPEILTSVNTPAEIEDADEPAPPVQAIENAAPNH